MNMYTAGQLPVQQSIHTAHLLHCVALLWAVAFHVNQVCAKRIFSLPVLYTSPPWDMGGSQRVNEATECCSSDVEGWVDYNLNGESVKDAAETTALQ